MELVRIVILQYNQSEYTKKLVSDLEKQEYHNYDIIIVDNGSRIVEWENLKSCSNDKITVVRSETNLGYAKGNNLGCKLETMKSPRYYLILNNDLEIIDRFFIKKLVESVQVSDKIIAVSPLVNTLSSNIALEKQIQVRRLPSIWDVIVVGSPILKRIFSSRFNRYIYKDLMPFVNKLVEVESINGAAFLVDAELFRSIGYFDENTFLYYEEIILAQRFKSAGYSCVLNGTTTVKHFQGASSFNTRKEKFRFESEYYFLKQVLNANALILWCYSLVRAIDLFAKKIMRTIQTK